VAFFFIEGMVDFEISFFMALLYELGGQKEMTAEAETMKPVKIKNGITLTPQITFTDLDPDSVKASVINCNGR